MLLGFVQLSGEKSPCGAGAVDLIEEGWTGTEHLVSVAGVGHNVEGEFARPASEFFPSNPTAGPTAVELDGAPI